MRGLSVTIPLLALAPSVLGQNLTFLAGLLSQLEANGLTQLVTIASSVNGTPAGQQLLADISSGHPYVLFAPNNAAWSSAPSNVTSDQGILTDVFSYHVVPGNFSAASTHYPNVTLGQTLYNDSATVHLEGGKSQVVAWSIRSDNKTHILNQRNDSTVVNVTSFGNLMIYAVDHVLDVPETLDLTISTNNGSLTGFQSILSEATLSYYNSTTNETSDISFFAALNTGYRGFTLFSPNNTAIDAANSSLTSLASNRTALNNVLFNHFINVSTLYSPLLAGSQNYTSAGGEPLTFSINSTGQYVTSGNVTALIVQPDVLLPNGVVHIIDRVLLNTDSDASAASSALSSASTAATAVASQTAPIGFSQTQSLGGPSGTASGNGASGSGSGSNGAVSGLGLLAMGKEKVWGILTAAVGVVVGGIFVVV